MSEAFIATHVIQTGTRREYVRAYALGGGPADLTNPRGVVLYTEDEWRADAHADWTFDPEHGLRFQGSASAPVCDGASIESFEACRWTRVDGWADDGTRAAEDEPLAVGDRVVGR